jgi:hypothetical protein
MQRGLTESNFVLLRERNQTSISKIDEKSISIGLLVESSSSSYRPYSVVAPSEISILLLADT